MAELSTEDRLRIWRGLMRYWSKLREEMALDKEGLAAAVAATDTWIDENAASYNAALPVAARTALTATQKTVLFCVVALARVSIVALKRLVGEVD